MKAFRVVVRALAVLALLTGAVDVLIGLPGQQKIGAALAEGYTDPLLNSQLRYLGAVWFGFGVLLWHCLGDLPKYASIVRGAFIIVFIGGLGRRGLGVPVRLSAVRPRPQLRDPRHRDRDCRHAGVAGVDAELVAAYRLKNSSVMPAKAGIPFGP